jgi:hypothetical protein
MVDDDGLRLVRAARANEWEQAYREPLPIPVDPAQACFEGAAHREDASLAVERLVALTQR